MHQTHVAAACETTGHQADEGAEVVHAQTVQSRFGDAADDAGDKEAEEAGLAVLILRTNGTEEGTQSNAPSGAGGNMAAEDGTGLITGLKILDIESGNDSDVHTGHDEELPDGTDDTNADEAGSIAERSQTAGEQTAEDVAQRSQSEEADRSSNKDSEGREK